MSMKPTYEELQLQLAAAVAENGQMLRLLTDISENHDEYVNADEYLYAGVPMDYVSEINAYVSRDVDAENPFKATDAYLAEVRAQARNELIDELESRFAELSLSETLSPELKSGAAGAAGLVSTFRREPDNEFAAQLRQGAEK